MSSKGKVKDIKVKDFGEVDFVGRLLQSKRHHATVTLEDGRTGSAGGCTEAEAIGDAVEEAQSKEPGK